MRSKRKPAKSTMIKLPTWWHIKVTPEMVARTRSPYTSAVRAEVKGTLATHENPAATANAHIPNEDGIHTNITYPIPRRKYTAARTFFLPNLSDNIPAPFHPESLIPSLTQKSTLLFLVKRLVLWQMAQNA